MSVWYMVMLTQNVKLLFVYTLTISLHYCSTLSVEVDDLLNNFFNIKL